MDQVWWIGDQIGHHGPGVVDRGSNRLVLVYQLVRKLKSCCWNEE